MTPRVLQFARQTLLDAGFRAGVAPGLFVHPQRLALHLQPGWLVASVPAACVRDARVRAGTGPGLWKPVASMLRAEYPLPALLSAADATSKTDLLAFLNWLRAPLAGTVPEHAPTPSANDAPDPPLSVQLGEFVRIGRVERSAARLALLLPAIENVDIQVLPAPRRTMLLALFADAQARTPLVRWREWPRPGGTRVDFGAEVDLTDCPQALRARAVPIAATYLRAAVSRVVAAATTLADPAIPLQVPAAFADRSVQNKKIGAETCKSP